MIDEPLADEGQLTARRERTGANVRGPGERDVIGSVGRSAHRHVLRGWSASQEAISGERGIGVGLTLDDVCSGLAVCR